MIKKLMIVAVALMLIAGSVRAGDDMIMTEFSDIAETLPSVKAQLDTERTEFPEIVESLPPAKAQLDTEPNMVVTKEMLCMTFLLKEYAKGKTGFPCICIDYCDAYFDGTFSFCELKKSYCDSDSKKEDTPLIESFGGHRRDKGTETNRDIMDNASVEESNPQPSPAPIDIRGIIKNLVR